MRPRTPRAGRRPDPAGGMDGVRLAEFTLPPAGGTAVPICLDSARWFCTVLRSDPAPELLAAAAGRLADAYAVAAEVAGADDPTLLPVRELLVTVTRAATGAPTPPPGDLGRLPELVLAAPTGLVTRLRDGPGGHQLRGYERAIEHALRSAPQPQANCPPAPPRPDGDVLAVHMSCARLDDTPDRTPPVSAVVVRDLAAGTVRPFAAYQSAERAGGPIDPLRAEADVLRGFYGLVRARPRAVWLHWNMNEARFGFAPLAQRHWILTEEEPPAIPPAQQFDLSEYLKGRFGDDYAGGHPRLHAMVVRNGLGGTRYLDKASSDRAWAEGRHAALADSVAAKVTAIADMYRRLWDGTLRIGGDQTVGIESARPCPTPVGSSATAFAPSGQPGPVITVAPVPLVGGTARRPVAAPFVPLTSWDEIFATLNEPHDAPVWRNDQETRAKVRRLNDTFDGPIVFPAVRGSQPSVGRRALIDWWNGLAERFEGRPDDRDRRADAPRERVGPTHHFGRTGVVAPDIGGHVRKSRRPK